MNELNKKMKNRKNRFTGEIKQVAGKISGNEQLELEGRIQSAKANFNEKVSIDNNVDIIKENIAKKINDRLDKKKNK